MFNLVIENLNYDSYDLAKYLISLFYRTNKEYDCTKYKLTRLLIIAALVTSYNGKQLIDGALICSKDATRYMFDTLFWLEREIYLDSQHKTKNSEILDNEISPTDESVPIIYRCNELDNDVKVLLYDVFKHFAAYSRDDLAGYLDEILPLLASWALIDLRYTKDTIDSLRNKNNKVINYVVNFNPKLVKNIQPCKTLKKPFLKVRR